MDIWKDQAYRPQEYILLPAEVLGLPILANQSSGQQSKIVQTLQIQEVHLVVAARIVSHTTDTDTDTKRTNYLSSAQTKYTWHNGRYARAHMDRGGTD